MMTRRELLARRAAPLLKRQGELRSKMQAIVGRADDRGQAMNAEENREWEQCDREYQALETQLNTGSGSAPVVTSTIDGRQPQEPHGGPYARTRRPSHSARQPAGETAGWIDKRTGESIRVLAPDEPLASADTEGLYSFGDFARALLLGPKSDAEQFALNEASIGSGGALVPAPLSATIIDAMRAKSVCIALGARTIPMDSKTLDLARVVDDPKPTWREESSDVPEKTVTFDRMSFVAKSCSFIVRCSRELAEDAANLDTVLRDLFAKVGAAEIDRVALVGHGDTSPSNHEPTGLRYAAGVNEISLGEGDGAALTDYDPILDGVGEILGANGAMPTGMALNPRVLISLAKLKQATTNASLAAPPLLDGVERRSTTAIPADEGFGSPEQGSAIFLGGWPDMYIGLRTEMNVRPLVERYADKGEVGFWAWLRMDVQFAHAKSFARILGVTR